MSGIERKQKELEAMKILQEKFIYSSVLTLTYAEGQVTLDRQLAKFKLDMYHCGRNLVKQKIQLLLISFAYKHNTRIQYYATRVTGHPMRDATFNTLPWRYAIYNQSRPLLTEVNIQTFARTGKTRAMPFAGVQTLLWFRSLNSCIELSGQHTVEVLQWQRGGGWRIWRPTCM